MKKPLTYPGYKLVFGDGDSGKAVYVRDGAQYQEVKRMVAGAKISYQNTLLVRGLAVLSADPLQSQAVNSAADYRSFSLEGQLTFRFYIYESSVFIDEISVQKPEVKNLMGIYKVNWKKLDKFWLVAREHKQSAFDKSETWRSKDQKAHYAALAGDFDGDIEQAGRLLAAHILGGYGKKQFFINEDILGAERRHFSMLWMADEKHKSSKAADLFAKSVLDSVHRQLPVNWLIHGRGVDTFKKAAPMIREQLKEQLKTEEGKKAIKQRLYFSNPSSGTEKSLQKLCENAGFEFVGANLNPRDLKRFGALVNVCSEMGKQLTIAGASGTAIGAGVALKQIGVGGIDKVYQTGASALMAGNHVTAALCVAGGGLILWGAKKNLDAIRAGVKSTFGKGNQHWYAGDKELLAAE